MPLNRLSEEEELELLELEKEHASQEPKRRSPMEMVGRQVGLTARAGIEGLASVPLAITDAPVTVKRAFGMPSGKKGSEVLSEGLTKLGLPEAETGTERVVQDIAGGMAGTAGAAKGLTKGAVRLSDLARGGGAGGTAGGLREAGAPEWLGTLAGTAVGMTPGKVGLKPPKPENVAHDTIIKNARAEGYKLPPESMTGKGLTMVAGKGPVKAALTMENQTVTNKIARRESGLGPAEPITDENLAAARTELAQPYRDLEKMAPAAGKLWKEVQQTRADAKEQWQFYNRLPNPEVKAKAQALDRRAEVLEGQIDDIAKLNFKPEALANLRKARRELAKNFTVDRANTPGGDVDAKAIYRDSKKSKMTGGLKTIADFEVERRPHFGVEMALEPDMHVGGGLGLHHLGAWGYLGAGIPGVRGFARQLALSKLGQGPKSNAQMGIPLSAVTNFLGRQTEQDQ
jgi:hypothetical protein